MKRERIFKTMCLVRIVVLLVGLLLGTFELRANAEEIRNNTEFVFERVSTRGTVYIVEQKELGDGDYYCRVYRKELKSYVVSYPDYCQYQGTSNLALLEGGRPSILRLRKIIQSYIGQELYTMCALKEFICKSVLRMFLFSHMNGQLFGICMYYYSPGLEIPVDRIEALEQAVIASGLRIHLRHYDQYPPFYETSTWAEVETWHGVDYILDGFNPEVVQPQPPSSGKSGNYGSADWLEDSPPVELAQSKK